MHQGGKPGSTGASRHRDPGRGFGLVLNLAAVLSLIFSIYIIFNLGTMTGFVPFETQYFYALQALLMPLVFLVFPFRGNGGKGVPLLDIVLAVTAFLTFAFMAMNGRVIMDTGWEYDAPVTGEVAAFSAWLLVLEVTRRAGGTMLFVVCLVFSVYPAIGYLMPGFLETASNSWSFSATYHAFGTESIIGLPTNVFAQLIIGYLLFGVALQYTGGGEFFLNLAFALLGRFRGGPAKVSVVASGMMGSLSGSVVSNVLTTGVLTIPAMKKVGFRPAYAAGVEACASTGGALMPPIMGAAAFIMAFILSVPYSTIIVAAVIPSFLYYLALFVQIDAYAARNGLQGLPKADIPPLGKVLREGWYFVFVLTLLVFLLLYMQQEAQAPFYATALLISLNQLNSRHRWNRQDFLRFLQGAARLFAELCAVVAGVGMIIGALSLTGKVGTIAYEIVRLAGDSVIALLLLGAFTCFILGTGMTSSAAYLFLAITLAPGLVDAGLNPIAIHMFILYWAMISFITPPVALGSFCAATLAGSPPWKAGVEGMRLGSVIYFVPFFFVINPALVMQAPFPEIAAALLFAIVGVIFIAAGMQGYLAGVGPVPGGRLAGAAARVLLVLSGFVFALPGGDFVGFSHWELAALAAVAGILAILLMTIGRSRAATIPVRNGSP
jgi:TRAP transporter 4TM/12TM fusion protein